MARHLLYFTAEDHYLYASTHGRLELEAKFPGDDLGVTAFREHLRGRQGALFAVVADLAGEDFHEDQVPLLRGSDREAIGRLQAMIEPALTVFLGAILGWVMLSVLGPVYDAISKMKF